MKIECGDMVTVRLGEQQFVSGEVVQFPSPATRGCWVIQNRLRRQGGNELHYVKNFWTITKEIHADIPG